MLTVFIFFKLDQKQLIGQLNYTIALNQFESTNNEIPLTDNALLAYRLGLASPACRLSNRRLELNELVNELHLKDKELSRICEGNFKIRILFIIKIISCIIY